MVLELLILGGYGQFVWPSFIFTFASCLILYVRTKKELQKQEKMFLNEYKKRIFQELRLLKEKKLEKKLCLVPQFKYLKSSKNIKC